MTDDILVAKLNKLIAGYEAKIFKAGYKESIAIAKELKGKLLDVNEGFTKNTLAEFFVSKYGDKKIGQPIDILDDLAKLLKQVFPDKINAYDLTIASVVNDQSEDIENDETLGVYRLLSQKITLPRELTDFNAQATDVPAGFRAGLFL